MIRSDQMRAVDIVSQLLKLVKAKIFDDALRALVHEDFEKFSVACIEAGIPDVDPNIGGNLHHMLYVMLRP